MVRPSTFLDSGAPVKLLLTQAPLHLEKEAAGRRATFLESPVTGVAVPVMTSRGHWLHTHGEKETSAGAMAASVGIGGLSS